MSPVLFPTTTPTLSSSSSAPGILSSHFYLDGLGVPPQQHQQVRFFAAAGRRPWDPPPSSSTTTTTKKPRRAWDPAPPPKPQPARPSLDVESEDDRFTESDEEEEGEGKEAASEEEQEPSSEEAVAGEDDEEEDEEPKEIPVHKIGLQEKIAEKKRRKAEELAARLARNKAEGVTRNAGGELYFELPKKRRVTVSTKRDGIIVDLRQYYTLNGQEMPSEVGISFSAENFRSLVQLIENQSIERQMDRIDAKFAELAAIEKQKQMERKALSQERKMANRGKKKKKKKN